MGASPFDNTEVCGPTDLTPLQVDCARLRLHHLFVLTAVMAVLLAINGPHRSYETANYQPTPLLRMSQLIVGIAHTILSATALTALGYGIVWYRRGLPFFNQPGHWLLVEISITTLIGIVPSVAYRLMATGDSKRMIFGDARMVMSFILIGYMLLFLVFGRMAIDIYFGRKKCSERWWKLVFYAKAVSTMLFGLGNLIVMLFVIHALRVDRQERVPRSASHRSGVALQLALSGLTLLSTAMAVYTMLTHLRR
jgi:hypothetical protein